MNMEEGKLSTLRLLDGQVELSLTAPSGNMSETVVGWDISADFDYVIKQLEHKFTPFTR